MKIAISAGHGQKIRGASGYIDEYNENVRVTKRVNELLNANGVTCVWFTDTVSTSQDANLNAIVSWHNKQTRDYDCSVHFNAYSTTSKPMGTEVWWVTQQQLAAKVSAAMATAGKFINRGDKKSTGLYFLNKTNKPSILLEVCFVDSSTDADLYKKHFEAICKAIAESIAGITIGTPPIEPPVEPPVEPGPEIATLTITTERTGNYTIVFNQQELDAGDGSTEDRVIIDMAVEGAVRVIVNGQDYNNIEETPEPTFQPNHQNIICSVFGGNSDPNDSAYPPYDFITDQELSCALPWKFTGERPSVFVQNLKNGKTVICQIRDVGPWLVDDDKYVLGDKRPVAEPKGSKIPRGKNKGKTSNGAGLDLTPAAAKAIGLSGMGNVQWRFITPDEETS